MSIEVVIHKGGYEEKEQVITDIKFSVQSGELVGLIGANGAGKSTTLQAIMGVLPFMDGHIAIDAYGYVPERPIIYEYFTLWEHIDFYMCTVGKEKELTARAYALLEIFHLDGKLHEFPTSFSKGMQQKVMLILAFLENRSTYILDEPFMGLDPQAMRKLLHIIEELKKKGAAILMSTHALDIAEKMCDRFMLINNGQILQQGTLKELQTIVSQENGSLLDVFDALLEENAYV